MRRSGTRTRASWALASVAGFFVASWGRSANAAPFDLEWAAPVGCPSREQMVDATLERLGDPSVGAQPEFFVQGSVQPESGGFVVTLALHDASGRALGERQVRVARQSCAAILEPVSLVLVMMISVALPQIAPSGESEERPSPPAPSVAAESPQAPPPTPAKQPPRPEAARAPAQPSGRILLGVGGVAARGVLPTAGLGVAVRAAYATGPFMIGLETDFEVGSSVRAATGEIAFQLFSAAARAGLTVIRTPRFELIPTIGARGVLIRTSLTGLRIIQDDSRGTVLVGPGALARFMLAPHVFAELLPEVSSVLLRDRFQIRDDGKLIRVHRPSPFEARLSLGIGFEFP